MSQSRKQRATDRFLRPPVEVHLVEWGARIEVKLPPDEAAQFVKFARAKHHKTTRVIGGLVNEFLPSLDQRERDGYVQPQVPRRLRDRFKSVAKQRGLGGGAAYLRGYLERWINPKTGKRRRRGGRSLRPRRSQEFATRGRELIMAAQGGTGGESVARYSFDARNSKVGLMNLTRAMNLSISEFFSALMERACTDWEKANSAKADVDPVSGGSAAFNSHPLSCDCSEAELKIPDDNLLRLRRAVERLRSDHRET